MTCVHPHGRHMYKQYASAGTAATGITFADLFGGINPFDWRIEYCGDCRQVLKTYGPVPPNELPQEEHHGD